MTFFLSCEAQSGGAGLLMRYHQLTQPRLNILSDRCYGQELTEIAIISIFVSDELFVDGGWKERKLFQRKSRSADLRLRLNYREFLSATSEHRATLYCTHILDSIETLRGKVSRDFQFDALIQDIRTILHDPVFLSELTAIRRFP